MDKWNRHRITLPESGSGPTFEQASLLLRGGLQITDLEITQRDFGSDLCGRIRFYVEDELMDAVSDSDFLYIGERLTQAIDKGVIVKVASRLNATNVFHELEFWTGNLNFYTAAFRKFKALLGIFEVQGQRIDIPLSRLSVVSSTQKYVYYNNGWMDTATHQLIKLGIRDPSTVPDVSNLE